LSDLGLEHLTKTSEWNRLRSLLLGIIGILNINIGHNADFNMTLDRFGEALEILIVKEKRDYFNTINDLMLEIKSLHGENEKMRNEFKEVLTTLTIKKPVDEEIAELQARIMQLYNEKEKN